MWSTKGLELAWLPASPLWHCPVMIRVSGGGWKWHWRVDVSFAAWATRTLTRARQAGARLPGDPERGLRVIRAYLDELESGVLVEVDRRALSPVELGSSEILVDASEFKRFGLMEAGV